jgi:succinate dehydrogenase / fumarate reductase cytochrome b subunit
MNWILNYFTSSIGRKIIMSLTGLFLCLFLIIHLVGNLQLFIDDGGAAFNEYAYIMANNPLIKIAGILTYATILLHAFQGILLWIKNRKAKGQGYKASTGKSSSWTSRSMAFLGTAILVFIVVHLQNFWYKMKFGSLPEDANGFTDLYEIVSVAFKNPILVAFYVFSMAMLSFHLYHGFQSGFQSLGINHKKYTPFIKFLGIAIFAVLIPLTFAAMPIYFFLR